MTVTGCSLSMKKSHKLLSGIKVSVGGGKGGVEGALFEEEEP